jgi:hypothetical protein
MISFFKIKIFKYSQLLFVGGAVLLPQCSFQILVGVWLLLTTVLVNSYSGTVISYLTVPKMKSPIETFEDLTACENVGIVLREDFVIGKQILVMFSWCWS